VKNSRLRPEAVLKRFKYENKLGEKVIKQLLNSIFAKYRDLLTSQRSITKIIDKNHHEMSAHLTFESGSKYGKLLKLMLAVLTSPVNISTK